MNAVYWLMKHLAYKTVALVNIIFHIASLTFIMWHGLILWLTVIVICVRAYCPLKENSAYENYLKNLNLSSNVPPIEQYGEAMLINSSIHILSIIKIDASLQTVKFGVEIVMTWYDFRVRRSRPQNCLIKVLPNFLWNPEITVLQAIKRGEAATLGDRRIRVFDSVSVNLLYLIASHMSIEELKHRVSIGFLTRQPNPKKKIYLNVVFLLLIDTHIKKF